jgi:hypothetical protein
MFRTDRVRGTTDVSVPIMVIDSADGTPETAYDHASTGIDLWYRREGGAEVSITEAALAAWNSAHTDGGVEHGSDGRGRLDLPDAACAVGTDGATYVEYGGTITDMIVLGGVVQLVNETALSGLFSGTHSTTSADLGANAPANSIIGMTLYFPTVRQSRIVETYNTGTGVAGWTTALAAAPQDDEPWELFPTPPLDAVTIAAIQSGLAVPGSDMNLVDVPNPAAVTAIQSGLATSAALQTVDDEIAAIDTDVNTLLTRITSTLFTGITSLAEWLGLIAGKQAADGTAQTEVRATGAGSGTYDATTDSQEAIRDRGDAAWAGTGATAGEIADAVLDEALSGHTTAGTLGKAVADIETDATAILLDTNEIQTDDVPGLIATAQADLDLLTGADGATLATSQPNYAPALASVATEARLAELDAANLPTDIAALPTTAEVNAEVDTAIADAFGIVSGTVNDAGASSTEFEVTTDVGADIRLGALRFTDGALAGESRLVTHTGTTVAVVQPTSVPAGLTTIGPFSAAPANGAAYTFRPI